MVEEEEYGTLAWFQKYEPEAVEVAFPAGYAAGYAACKADVVADLMDRAKRAGNFAFVFEHLAERFDRDEHVGKAKP